MSGGRLALRGIHGPTREAVLELIAQGWSPERLTGKNHLVLRHECGAVVTAAGTASDRHAGKALLGSARRALRGAEARKARS